MNFNEIWIWFLVIFASDFVAQFLWNYIERRRKRRYAKIQCESCNQIRKTRKVNGQQLCLKCRKLLKESNNAS